MPVRRLGVVAARLAPLLPLLGGLGVGGCGGPAIAPKLSEIETKVFAPSCAFSASCHSAMTPRGGMSLVAPTFAQIVNQPSSAVPTKMRVKPGDPDSSFLFEKISVAKPSVGDRMPPQMPLDDAAIQAIRQWIASGAQNN